MTIVSRFFKRIYHQPFIISRMMSVTHKTLSADEVLFETRKNCGIITLHRPKALNALNLTMIRIIHPVLKAWENDPEIGVIIMKGSGDKAFCAGGDVVAITSKGEPSELSEQFFKEEYKLNFEIGNLNTPYIAMIHGITMGGGVGLSVHGRYRVATEKTLFAMPETSIGLFPDVGGGFFLPRLQGSLGIFLALTGNRLKGRDNYHAGVATHFVTTKELPYLKDQICNLENPSVNSVGEILDSYHKKCDEENHKFSLQESLNSINEVFSADTVEGIFKGLEKDGSEWALKQLEGLQKMSPISMKVTHRQLKEGRNLNFKDVLEMEYRISQQCMKDRDFYEGIRALLVDRDHNPKWNPSCVEDVSETMVESYFAHLPDGKELKLPEQSKL